MKKKESKGMKRLIYTLLIISILSSFFAIYEILLLSSIEDMIRYIVIGILVALDMVFIFSSFLKKKKKKRGFFIMVLILYSILNLLIGGAIYYFYGKIDHLNKDSITYTSDLIVLSTNPASKIDDIKEMKIGILSDQNNPEGAIIPRDVITKYKLEDDNEIVLYDDYTTMVVDLYEGDLDSLFITDGYVSMFSEISGYEDISSRTKVIISQSKKMRKKDTSKVEVASTGKSVTEPFTLLIMGIDSTDEVLAKNAIANGDTLILVTFNPKTLNATMLSIPRDSYVPISCWNGKPENKITHAAAYGTDCMIHTIEDYLDTNIDYYTKINFKGLVKLVDAVGGVEVDVKQELCTDDSGRLGEVCIQPGLQVLDGEHALVYARNRKQLANGDFGRSEHQQEIIKLLMNKIKTLTDVTKFMDILNTVSNSVDTNLTTKQILSFYNIGKDIVLKSLSNEKADVVNFQTLFLDGVGQMIYDERAKMVLWDYIPNKNSRRDVVQAMKENLGLESHKMITEFHFSINQPYVQKVIGEGPYSNTVGYSLLPDFTGDTESTARATALKLGISVTFKGGNGTVIDQSYPAKKRIDLIKDSVVLTLSGSSRQSYSMDDEEDEEKEDNKSEKEENWNNEDNEDNKSELDNQNDNNLDGEEEE